MVLVDANHLRPSVVESYAEMYSSVLSCLQTQYIEHPVLDDILGSPVKALVESERLKRPGLFLFVCLFVSLSNNELNQNRQDFLIH